MLKKTIAITVMLTLNFTPSVFGESSSSSSSTTSYLPSFNEQLAKDISEISARQGGGTQRPQACPMESNNHIDLLTKVQNIKSLFQENCLDGDQSMIDEVLEGAESLQTEINQINPDAEEEDSDELQGTDGAEIDLGGVSLDGETVASVLTNLNSIYTKNSCKGLADKTSFLSATADVILDISKIGLLVPNTTVLTIAGGGVALSSTLTILDNIFSKRFNFEETEDRQTFIKLNCAFYDIRRDIEKSGFLDVPTEAHTQDIEQVTQLLQDIEKENKQFEDKVEELEKEFNKTKEHFYIIQSNHLYELVNNLKHLKEKINTPVEFLSQKLALIEIIARAQPVLMRNLDAYIKSNDEHLEFLDQQFKVTLEKFGIESGPENLIVLQDLEISEFLNTIVEQLKYHSNRLELTYQQNLTKIDKKWAETIYRDELKPVKYLEVFEKEKKDKIEIIQKNYLALSNVKDRLKRIVDEVSFTSLDDGSENVVSILSEFDSIVDQIYGKYGEKFLEYTTKKSIKLNKTFTQNFNKFAENHLEIRDTDYLIKKKENIDPLRLMFACQDARPFRRQWKLAESLSQQGYDFVATNADLFHSDIDRVFLGRSGDRRFGIHNILSRYETIQMHHKSSIYAKKVINGKKVSKEKERKYLKKKYLGRSMLEVTESKKKAVILQKLIESYDCPKQTIMP